MSTVESLPRAVAAAPQRPRAYSYIRMSSDVQLAGDSLRRQLQAVETWCRTNALELDEDLRDLGISGFSGENTRRGALGAFLALVEDGRVPRGSVLLVEHLDRLSRQEVRKGVRLMLGILDAGIDIVTMADGHRYRAEADPTAQMTDLIISIVGLSRGNDESRIKSLRIGGAWAQKRSRARCEGHKMTAKCPAWLYLKDGVYKPNEDRVKILKSIFAMAADGLGRRTIARRLNTDHFGEVVKPWGRGAGWQDSYVQKILTSRAPLGFYQPGVAPKGCRRTAEGEEIAGYFPAVIDEVTWHRANNASKARRQGGGRRGIYRNLLQGLCRCADCKQGMEWVDKGVRSSGPVLMCSGRRRGLKCEHADKYRYTFVEVGVFFTLRGRIRSLMARAVDAQSTVADELAAASAKRVEMNARVERLLDLIETDSDPGTAARLRLRRVEIARLDEDIERLNARAASSASTASAVDGPQAMVALYDELRAMPPDERSAARARVNQRLRELVERIEFAAGRAEIKFRDGTSGQVMRVGG